MYQNIPTKVLTSEVRLSYSNLTTPRASKKGGEPKYSVTLLVPKTDVTVKADLDASIEAAAQGALTKLWGGIRPPVLPAPVHDGDGVKENGTPYGPECKGCWVINASAKSKPQVVHQSNVNAELAPQDVYSGMYARVTINFFGYLAEGKKGVGCGLGNVMKTRDGEPLAGGASAEMDFAGVGSASGTAPATPGYAVPGYPPPMPGYQAPVYQQPAYGGGPVLQPAVNPLTGMPYAG